jgi:hypothetical protein
MCFSIGSKRISQISTSCAWYLTILALNCCNMAQDLIGCSMNGWTYPGAMSSTFVILPVHDESFLAWDLTMSYKSTNSSGASNYGRMISLIARLILVQLFSHSTHFSWISWWDSSAIFTQYLIYFLMQLMFLYLSTWMVCSSASRPCCTTLI